MDDSKLVTIDVPGTGNIETATCAEWFAVGCTFVEPDVCPDYQGALSECCADSPPVEPTPRPPTQAPAAAPSEGGGNSVRTCSKMHVKSLMSVFPHIFFSIVL